MIRRRGRRDAGAGSPVAAECLSLVLDCLAAYRLTRLATADVIGEPARRLLVRRSLGERADEALDGRTSVETVEAVEDPPNVARLITCRWCAGMWIAAGVVAARALAPSIWDPAARALSVSAAAALLAGLEDD